jgi:hypothetical protein
VRWTTHVDHGSDAPGANYKRMIGFTLALAFGLAFAGASVAPGQASATSTRISLPNCLGRPIVEPTDIVLTCADGGFLIKSIHWTGWGESFAAGMGTGSVNDCAPNCANGHYHSYPMLLVVTGRQSCPNGQFAYAKVTYAFIGRSPFPQDAPGTEDPTQRFPCRPMP